ncbi:MAG: response regulator [Nitrospinota bacterium]|nr:response regulator [Nitrospinota bacterium]
MLESKDYLRSKILIVDDEPGNVILLEQMMIQEGYNCLYSTSDSTQCIDMFAEVQPDLVLLDLNMPRMDGFEVMAKLKEIDPKSMVPILVLTALTDEKTKLHALRSGAKDFLNKPFELTEASLRIKNLLEMRLLHQKVQMHNQILEEQVQIRTAELERSTEELTNFAYIASHDLQEPLRKIITFGDRLVEKFDSALNDTGKDYIVRMQKSALRMKGLIDDLLHFSRVTMRSAPFQEINLNEVISEVLSDLEVQIERTKGRVEVDTLPSIEGGKFQMRQLFQNLISNGLKYHSDEVAPVIKIKYAGFENDFEEIYIEDNGKGFDEKHLDRIFRPFERLHGHNEYGGTGMGLAICHKIVVHHRGEITAKSQPNQGATFIVRLPSRQRKE